MESRHDSENADRVLRNMANTNGGGKQLLKAIAQAYEMHSSQALEVARMRQQLVAQMGKRKDSLAMEEERAKEGKARRHWLGRAGASAPAEGEEEPAAQTAQPFGSATSGSMADPKEVIPTVIGNTFRPQI